MRISKIPGFGSYGQLIQDADFADLSDNDWILIAQSHLKNLLTVFQNPRNLSKDEFIRRIDICGPTKGSVRAHYAKKYGRVIDAFDPESLKGVSEEDQRYLRSRTHMIELTETGKPISRIYGAKDADGNMLGSFDSGDLGWHSNEASQLTFAPEVALMGSQLMIGSATGFVQTADYYQDVSDSFRSELDDMILVHTYKQGFISPAELENPVFSKQIQLNFCPEEGLQTPMVITSPGGIRGLHYAVHSASYIQGMSVNQSEQVFAEINKQLFREPYTYYHHYQHDNDMLMFDNSITLHCRLGGETERKAYRIQYEPCNLYSKAWAPYSQPEFAEQYLARTKELVDILGLPNFTKTNRIVK